MIINVRARNKEMYSVREAIIIIIFWLTVLELVEFPSPFFSISALSIVSLSLFAFLSPHSTPSIDGQFHSSCYLLLITSFSSSYLPLLLFLPLPLLPLCCSAFPSRSLFSLRLFHAIPSPETRTCIFCIRYGLQIFRDTKCSKESSSFGLKKKRKEFRDYRSRHHL